MLRSPARAASWSSNGCTSGTTPCASRGSGLNFYGDEMSLTTRARQLYRNRLNGAKWVLAVRYMRKRGIWVLENGCRPDWGNK